MSGKWSRRLALSFALALLSILIVWPSAAAADSPPCRQDEPADHAFVVELCLTAPSSPDVSGEVIVSATATWLSGPTNPRVQRMVFFLDGQPLLTDYSDRYEFELPTWKWVDGEHVLEVEDMTRYIEPATGTNFVTGRVSMTLSFDNGVDTPPVNGNTFTPTTGSTPQDGQPFLVMATGDGASGEPGADAVSSMISSSSPNLFLYLGDVYEQGTYTEFYNWYGHEGSRWSSFKNVTNPTIGNHEYINGAAPGYFDYWDNVPNYYSVDTHGWHFVTINSNSTFGQHTPGTTQYEWLKADLEASSAQCTVAYMHHPRYSIGTQGDTSRLDDVWRLLAANGVDIVIGANDHNYQRWVPLGADGQPAAGGMTQFVVGTGGHGIRLFDQGRVDDSRVEAKFDTGGTNDTLDARGALQLKLGASGAEFAYVKTDGEVLDSGSIGCSPPPDDTAPVVTVPASFSVNATSPAGATVTYTASASDNGGSIPVTCTPASGGTFAIGTTTVSCTASDASGNSGSASFGVTVKGAHAQFVDLIEKTLRMLNLPPLRAAMRAHIESAARSLVGGNRPAACRAMNHYIDAVRWLKAIRKLNQAQADELIGDAMRIKRVIGCS